MLDIFDGNSKVYKKVVHEALDIVEHFMEVGSNLEYDEIYGSVFPLHKQDEENKENQGLAFLKKLHREIIDNFSHEFSPLKEYVLYHILFFVHEGSEGTFLLSDTIQKSLNKRETSSLDEDELTVLNTIETPKDLIGVCFEDLDFLKVEKIFDIYKTNPKVVTDFLHVDLEYYKDLLPDDIFSEYKQIQEYLTPEEKSTKQNTVVKAVTETINSKDDFYKKVDSLIATFKHFIEHKKVHILFNDKKIGQAKEKQVQVAFWMMAKMALQESGIVISPEVDTGRGIVDFQLSKGADFQALIELKLGNHGRYKDGLNFLLPTYLLIEQVDYGFFVLVCYTQEIYEEAKSLHQKAEELSQKYNRKIRFERIDASGTLESASKIRTEKDIGFK
ncbi:hypothetical protein CN689_15620 [Peribacillus butanolivorans]|uniref:DUF91 domain-containing protein n=1 Tax=Peribacillus butanolivorans TaxID=421767 RepID=A0AAX0RRD6_9BACI|nr:hypothetical protein DTO10_17300 [Peribacillus butanolivorans]PEJ31629.1 hypothetical protein CN689_15620 [Peribacillus butanolivorans]